MPTIGDPIARGRVKPTTALKAWPVAFSPAGMLSFLLESRRVDNRRMLAGLGLQLQYPTLQSGVLASFAEMRHTHEAGTT